MKIGILTQHFLLNYGGIIQNYALQQVLIRLGHDPLTFEHDTCYSTWWWLLRCIKHLLKNRTLKGMPVRPVYKGRIGNKNFICFILANIRSVPIRDFQSGLTRRYGIDAYIVGSDQVWRPAFNLGPRLDNMFLDFADDKVRKIAYAASFGTSKWEYTPTQETQCKRLAQRFDAISVREESAVNLCREHFGVEAVHVLDPTLLLKADDYLRVCHDVPASGPHIFVYSLVQGERLQQLAEGLSSQTSLTVVTKQAGDKVCPEDSIEAWIAEFRDAAYVLTDSFHGMVFSILFHKPFWIVKNPSGGNERYVSLLTKLGLMDRIVEDGLSEKPIDWRRVDGLLDAMRLKSLSFLKDSLK